MVTVSCSSDNWAPPGFGTPVERWWNATAIVEEYCLPKLLEREIGSADGLLLEEVEHGGTYG